MGNRIYGCDDCLAVCPWNKFAEVASPSVLNPRVELEAPLLTDLVCLDEASFRIVFTGSPIKRIGRDRFVRNVLIAIGNSGLAEMCAVIEPLCRDESPLVRAMVVWALNRLDKGKAMQVRESLMQHEVDSYVRGEWAAV